MPGTYTRTNGQEVDIDDLDFHHSKSALAKLQRTDPKGRAEEIANLQVRVDMLAAEWAAENPDKA